MHPADIKAEITKAGLNQSALARTLKNRRGDEMSPGAVWLVVQGQMKSAQIARRISEVTGLPVAKLWPGKYPGLEAEQSAPAPTRKPRSPKRMPS